MGRPTDVRLAFPVLARFWPHVEREFRAQSKVIIAAVAAVIGQAALRIAEPWPLKWVIDSVTGSGNPTPFGIETGNGAGPLLWLWIAAAAFVVLVSARAAAGYASSVAFAAVGNRVLLRVRKRLFEHLQRLSPAFHARARRGDLVLRVVADVGVVKEVFVTAGMPMLANAIVFLGMVGVMLWLDPRLALAALAPVPLYLGFALRTGRRVREVGRRQRRREGALAATAQEALSVLPMIQSLGLGERLSGEFGQLGEQEGRVGVEGKRLSARLERSVDVLVAVCTAVVLSYGGARALAGELSAGDLVVFVSYVRRGLRPIRDFAKYGARIAKASAAAERVLEVLEEVPDIVESDAARDVAITGRLQFDNVTIRNGEDSLALQDVRVSIEPGRSLALMGPSGSGKSTLLGLVSRLRDPCAGRLLIDGHDIRDITLDSLRSQITVLLQEPMLLAGSVFENVACAATDASEGDVREALVRAQAWAFVERLPRGLETDIAEDGARLSRGERQRIAIARAIIRRAAIVLLDEPTTGLDEDSSRAVRLALRELTADCTVLWATHSAADARECDALAMLDRGQIVALGTPDEVLGADRDLHVELG